MVAGPDHCQPLWTHPWLGKINHLWTKDYALVWKLNIGHTTALLHECSCGQPHMYILFEMFKKVARAWYWAWFKLLTLKDGIVRTLFVEVKPHSSICWCKPYCWYISSDMWLVFLQLEYVIAVLCSFLSLLFVASRQERRVASLILGIVMDLNKLRTISKVIVVNLYCTD